MVKEREYDVDATDYAILKCLAENDGCWKKQVHEWVSDHTDTLPHTEEKSVQTIGRRIDNLQQANVLDTCILNPDELNRDIIIGFKLNDMGRRLLDEARRTFLREQVVRSSDILLGEPGEISINREALIELMTDEFEIDPDVRETVLEQLESEDLVTVLAVHCFLGNVDDTVNTENEGLLTELLYRSPRLRAPIASDNVISRIRDTLMEQAEEPLDITEIEKSHQL